MFVAIPVDISVSNHQTDSQRGSTHPLEQVEEYPYSNLKVDPRELTEIFVSLTGR